MKPALLPVVLVVLAVLIVVAISIIKNRKDKKELEEKLNDVFTRKSTKTSDVEMEDRDKT